MGATAIILSNSIILNGVFIEWAHWADSFRIFKTLSIPNHKSWGADMKREFTPPLCVPCHMSYVTYHMSHVRCHLVRCQVAHFSSLFFPKVLKLVREGLSRLVFSVFYYLTVTACLVPITHLSCDQSRMFPMTGGAQGA